MLGSLQGCELRSSEPPSLPLAQLQPKNPVLFNRFVLQEAQKIAPVEMNTVKIEITSSFSLQAQDSLSDDLDEFDGHQPSAERPLIATPDLGKDQDVNTMMDATAMVKRSDDLMRGETNAGQYSMHIITKKWQRELLLHVYSQGRDKVFIRITSPAKEAGISTLRIGNEMWNYLPNVERIIKIPPSMMLQPWMGSDFANDDLVKESSIVHDYTHQVMATEIKDGHKIYQIEMSPKPDAPVIWGKVLRWIREDDVPLKEQYFNESGKLVKELAYSDIGLVSDREIPRTWVMRSLIKEGHSTTIKLIDVTYNKPIAPSIFTRAYLKRIQ